MYLQTCPKPETHRRRALDLLHEEIADVLGEPTEPFRAGARPGAVAPYMSAVILVL
jgi:hypothetical protein